MKAADIPAPVLLALAAAAGLWLWTRSKGGAAGAGAAAGAAIVDAAGGVVSGAVGAAGAAVGLPTPAQTTTDARVARWIIDNRGWFEASKWSGAPALVEAMRMDSGTGTPPPAGSAAAVALGVTSTAPASAPWVLPSVTDGKSFGDLSGSDGWMIW